MHEFFLRHIAFRFGHNFSSLHQLAHVCFWHHLFLWKPMNWPKIFEISRPLPPCHPSPPQSFSPIRGGGHFTRENVTKLFLVNLTPLTPGPKVRLGAGPLEGGLWHLSPKGQVNFFLSNKTNHIFFQCWKPSFSQVRGHTKEGHWFF